MKQYDKMQREVKTVLGDMNFDKVLTKKMNWITLMTCGIS